MFPNKPKLSPIMTRGKASRKGAVEKKPTCFDNNKSLLPLSNITNSKNKTKVKLSSTIIKSKESKKASFVPAKAGKIRTGRWTKSERLAFLRALRKIGRGKWYAKAKEHNLYAKECTDCTQYSPIIFSPSFSCLYASKFFRRAIAKTIPTRSVSSPVGRFVEDWVSIVLALHRSQQKDLCTHFIITSFLNFLRSYRDTTQTKTHAQTLMKYEARKFLHRTGSKSIDLALHFFPFIL